MIKRALNRLWVRFSLSIIAIIFAVIILPSASLLLADPQQVVSEYVEYIEWFSAENQLGLSAQQIDYLAKDLALATEQDYVYDIQFLLLTTLIVGAAAGILLGRGLSLPFERLVTATKAIASQELTHRVEVKGAQEVTDLAENFNQMVASLAHSEQLRRNMMADVSHELLTPLTVLQGNLRAILDDVYELNKEEVGKLYEQNKHLIRLVRDLRQLSQAEAGQLPLNLTTLDVNALAHETSTLFMPLAGEKNIALISDFDTNLPPIQADSDRLRQVLHNLLANALRHTREGGQIVVSTGLATDRVRLTITDTGEGIAPELQPHVFDRFYRTRESRRRDSGGAGLGLAISKAFVEAQGGTISAKSEGVGMGTAVCFELPIFSRLEDF